MSSTFYSCGRECVGLWFKGSDVAVLENYQSMSARGQRMEGLAVIEVSIVKAIITTSGEINIYCTGGFKNSISKAK